MKRIKVKKGTVLQEFGELNTKVYHVISGLLRSYTLDKKGKEHIFMFAPEGWVVGDNITPDLPCELYIDAIEDSVVYVLPKDINRENKNAAAFIKRLAVLQKRVIMLMSASAMERYEHFEKTYPDIISRVTQKMIASYLGITPEALSTLKKARLKKK
ncbi:MAG: Crp/Fnr family transcriptional regulator [Bacteroidota bacterium]